MTYRTMIQEAQRRGLTSTEKMWQSVASMDDLLEKVKESHPREYWCYMREQHELLYGPHYSNEFAEYDISCMEWIDRNGEAMVGGHWTKDEVIHATEHMHFPDGTTPCDRWVAFNAVYADLCTILDDAQVLKVAHKYYFEDQDAPDGKIWHYMRAMHCE